ncbi:MAG: Ig-like domain-containing protein, partial [Tannerella sp.]|nr:Ig-like domain-containing protein [Tannerella sp.]
MKTGSKINYFKGMVTVTIILAACGCSDFKYDKFKITDKPFVNYTSIELFTGDGAGNHNSMQLISSPTDMKYTWSSADESVATVTQTGLVTAVSEGITIISVASQNDETKISVIVRKWIPLEDLVLDTDEKIIEWRGR